MTLRSKRLIAPPRSLQKNFLLIFISVPPQKKNNSLIIFACRDYTPQMQPKWHHIAAVLRCPWKVSVVFLWYNEFIQWPLGSALLQTSWRDRVCSFIPGCYYADGRRCARGVETHFKHCLFTRTPQDLLPHPARTDNDCIILFKERRDQVMHRK